MRLITSRNARVAGLDDIGADARAPVSLVIVLHVHARLALRVLALGHRVHLELAQHHGDAGGRLDGLEGGIHRSVPARAALDAAPVGVRQAHERAGRAAAARLGGELGQGPGSVGRAFRPQHQGLDVPVEELLLLVGERLEVLEDAVELELIELEPQRLHALAEGVAPGVLAEHQVAAREAHVLGAQDLVGRVVLEHAVLVDPRLVREGVLAHHRLVARDRLPGDARDQARGRIEAVGLDVGRDIEERGAGLQRHHHFLERAVAGALADAVDGALDLARPGHDRGQAVGDRHPEIVMAVHREADALDAAHVLAQVAEQLARTHPAPCSRRCRGC